MYTYNNGQWGSSNIDENIDLKHYGFTDYTEMVCRLGPLHYYSRYATGAKFQFAFLVKLYMGSISHGYYSVWVNNLPNLIQLFKELDVHPSQENNSTTEIIGYLRDETYFAEALEIMHETLQKQQDGN